MSGKQDIASSLNEIWGKLNIRWTGEDANAFYQQYIVKMIEIVEDFEETCSDFNIEADDLAQRLDLVERNIM